MGLGIKPSVGINMNKENKEYLDARNKIINILFLRGKTDFNSINNGTLLKSYITILRKQLITKYNKDIYDKNIYIFKFNNSILNENNYKQIYNYNPIIIQQIEDILIKYKADNDSQAKGSLNKLLSTSGTNNKDSVNSNNLNSQEWKQLINLAKKIIRREFELYKILSKNNIVIK